LLTTVQVHYKNSRSSIAETRARQSTLPCIRSVKPREKYESKHRYNKTPCITKNKFQEANIKFPTQPDSNSFQSNSQYQNTLPSDPDSRLIHVKLTNQQTHISIINNSRHRTIWLNSLAYIQKGPGSNLGWKTEYPDYGFSWLSSLPPEKCPTLTPFHILASPFRNHPTTGLHIIRSTTGCVTINK
jgi:hypothetical protein